MRTPLFWFLGWLAISAGVSTVWPQHSMWVSCFWIGWSMAIFGQDIADHLKRLTISEQK